MCIFEQLTKLTGDNPYHNAAREVGRSRNLHLLSQLIAEIKEQDQTNSDLVKSIFGDVYTMLKRYF